jgi:hypothetical protein
LLDQRVIKLAPALICGKLLMPLGRHFEGVPADQNRPRPLRIVEAQQQVGKPDDSAGTLAALALNALGQGVIGPMRKGVAVDD